MCCVAVCERKALRRSENDGVSAAAHLSWRREGGDWSRRRTRQEKGEHKREGTGESEFYNGGEKIVPKKAKPYA